MSLTDIACYAPFAVVCIACLGIGLWMMQEASKTLAMASDLVDLASKVAALEGGERKTD